MNHLSRNYFNACSLCLIFLSMSAHGMHQQESSLQQITERIKQTYNIDSCAQYLPNYSIKALYEPSLLWADVNQDQTINRDVVFQILGCKDIVWHPYLNPPLNANIRDYILHKDMPIKIFSIIKSVKDADQNEMELKESFSYRNTPQSEQQAYILAKHVFEQEELNHYLMGYLLGYTQPDIAYYYMQDAPNPAPILNIIKLLPNSLRLFTQQPSKIFTILPEEIQSLAQAIDNWTSWAGSETAFADDLKEMKTTYEKIQSSKNHAPILQDLLDRLATIKTEYELYLKNEWTKSTAYGQMQEDKIKAQQYIDENNGKTIEQLKQEIETISGHTIQDELASIRAAQQEFDRTKHATFEELAESIKKKYSIQSFDDLQLLSTSASGYWLAYPIKMLLSLILGYTKAECIANGTIVNHFLSSNEDIYSKEYVLRAQSPIKWVAVQIRPDLMLFYAYKDSPQAKKEAFLLIIDNLIGEGHRLDRRAMEQKTADEIRTSLEKNGYQIQDGLPLLLEAS